MSQHCSTCQLCACQVIGSLQPPGILPLKEACQLALLDCPGWIDYTWSYRGSSLVPDLFLGLLPTFLSLPVWYDPKWTSDVFAHLDLKHDPVLFGPLSLCLLPIYSQPGGKREDTQSSTVSLWFHGLSRRLSAVLQIICCDVIATRICSSESKVNFTELWFCSITPHVWRSSFSICDCPATYQSLSHNCPCLGLGLLKKKEEEKIGCYY